MQNFGGTYRGKRVLLIGGLGFIGRNLTQRFLREGASVTIVERNSKIGSKKYDAHKIFYEKCEVIDLDPLNNFNALERYISDSDIILNLIKNYENYESLSALNLKMLNFCRENNLRPLFVHFGSRLQYSRDNPNPMAEGSKLGAINSYGAEKIKSEDYFMRLGAEYKIPVICLRAANVYGPDKSLGENNGIINIMILSAIKGKITLEGDVERLKDFIYIDDFVEAVLKCIAQKECYGKVFNIGSGQGVSMMELAKLIRRLFNTEAEIAVKPADSLSDFSFYLNISKIKSSIDWNPKVRLEEGLERIKQGRGMQL